MTMPDESISASDVFGAIPRPFLKLIDVLTDGWKLMRSRDDIRQAVSEAVDALDVAAHSAEVAARDFAQATAKLRAAKDLIVTATD